MVRVGRREVAHEPVASSPCRAASAEARGHVLCAQEQASRRNVPIRDGDRGIRPRHRLRVGGDGGEDVDGSSHSSMPAPRRGIQHFCEGGPQPARGAHELRMPKTHCGPAPLCQATAVCLQVYLRPAPPLQNIGGLAPRPVLAFPALPVLPPSVRTPEKSRRGLGGSAVVSSTTAAPVAFDSTGHQPSKGCGES